MLVRSRTAPGGTLGSEDCLTLNVFAPIQKRNRNGRDHEDADRHKGLPVMVWHGGSLVTGSSSLYDPSSLVTGGGVIVVTINYRLGLPGFFAHAAIDAEAHLTGNYRLMDQQFALEWVRRNRRRSQAGHDLRPVGRWSERIRAARISHGGRHVPRAIAESGAYEQFQDYFNLIVPLAAGETTGTTVVPSGASIAAKLGCTGQTAQCLRDVPAPALVLAQGGILFPFVDGTLLKQTPADAFTSGQFNHVPLIAGGNHDEYRFFVNPLATPADYQNTVLAAVGPMLAPVIESVYPLAAFPSAALALSAIGTDGFFACPQRNSVRLLSKYVTTYAYEFNDEHAPQLLAPPTPAGFSLGAEHAAELQYLFDFNQRFAGINPFTPDQQQLSNTMIGYWTRFARTGDPNFRGAPGWLTYNSATDQFQSLVPPAPSAEPGFDTDHKCSSLWNTF